MILSRTRLKPWTSSPTALRISSLDASSMRPSAVCSVPPLSFSDNCTKTAGLNPTAAAKINPYLFGGALNGFCQLRPKDLLVVRDLFRGESRRRD